MLEDPGICRNQLKSRLAHVSMPIFFALLLVAPTSADLVDFEDGLGHDVVIPSNHYDGLTFTNAVWIGANGFLEGQFGLGVDAGVVGHNNWAFPGTSSPIQIEFAAPVSAVSIDAFDVQDRGARLSAFDTLGNLVGSDSVTSTVSSPLDVTLTVSGVDIRMIELSQLVESSVNGDGIGWDNLNYTSIPEPATPGLVSLVLLGIALRRRRKRT